MKLFVFVSSRNSSLADVTDLQVPILWVFLGGKLTVSLHKCGSLLRQKHTQNTNWAVSPVLYDSSKAKENCFVIFQI